MKLSDEFEVFVTKKALQQAKKCQSATAIAIYLLKQVFSPEACRTCSVSGKPKTRNGMVTVRPPLDEDEIDAIIGMLFLLYVTPLVHITLERSCFVLDFTKTRCLKKKWAEPNEIHLKSNMKSVQSDDRSRFLLLEKIHKKKKSE